MDLATTFEEEFLSYFALCLINLVFGAIALSFGVQHIIGSMLGQPGYRMRQNSVRLPAQSPWCASGSGSSGSW